MTDAMPLFEFTEKKQSPASPLSLPLSVSELTQQIRDCIETKFETVLGVGQVANLTYHRSGHV